MSQLKSGDDFKFDFGDPGWYDIKKVIVTTKHDDRFLEDPTEGRLKLVMYIDGDTYHSAAIRRVAEKETLEFVFDVHRRYDNPDVSFEIFIGNEAVNIGKVYVGTKIRERPDGVTVKITDDLNLYYRRQLPLLISVVVNP